MGYVKISKKRWIFLVAGPRGLEPRPLVLETRILPLNYRPNALVSERPSYYAKSAIKSIIKKVSNSLGNVWYIVFVYPNNLWIALQPGFLSLGKLANFGLKFCNGYVVRHFAS